MTPLSSRQQALLHLAKNFHLTSYREAVGCCFAAALGLAQAARAQGIAVELLRWQVDGDRDFCDHWGVACGDDMVIDLTRVQVDGNTALLHPVSAYPRHYRNLRRYPARLLFPSFERLCNHKQERMPFAFMWQSGLALARHDMKSACSACQWRRLGRSAWELAVFALRMLVGTLQQQCIGHPQDRMASSWG